MSKEKRILAVEVSGACSNLITVNDLFAAGCGLEVGEYCSAVHESNWTPIDPAKDCVNCPRAHYTGITRAEAVERMVKAMSADDIPVEGYKVLAVAALDALIKEI